jgi:hypothetical protein
LERLYPCAKLSEISAKGFFTTERRREPTAADDNFIVEVEALTLLKDDEFAAFEENSAAEGVCGTEGGSDKQVGCVNSDEEVEAEPENDFEYSALLTLLIECKLEVCGFWDDIG